MAIADIDHKVAHNFSLMTSVRRLPQCGLYAIGPRVLQTGNPTLPRWSWGSLSSPSTQFSFLLNPITLKSRHLVGTFFLSGHERL